MGNPVSKIKVEKRLRRTLAYTCTYMCICSLHTCTHALLIFLFPSVTKSTAFLIITKYKCQNKLKVNKNESYLKCVTIDYIPNDIITGL